MQKKFKVDFINSSYQRSYKTHKRKINKAIHKCLEKGDFILREEVERFEKTLANYIGVNYAVGVNSGTDALFLALKALDIGPGDEVITVSHTFIAPIQVIVQCGATPVLIDVGEDTLMDVERIKAAITKKTKAIMPVHLSGKVCEMDKIMDIAIKYDLKVIEDACPTLGGKWNNVSAGAWGDIGCISFISPKLLGCCGDGGAIVTDIKETYEKLLLLRNHWNITQNALLGVQTEQPEIMDWGWNSRLDNIQAAILNVKFPYHDKNLKRRKEIAETYLRELADLPITLPVPTEGQVWQEFIIRVNARDNFKSFMEEHGVELLVRDTTPNHKLKGLKLGYFILPQTEQMAKDSARLPIYPELTNKEIKYVIKTIQEFFKQ